MAPSRTQMGLTVALFCLTEWTLTFAFNLDTDNVITKTGEPGSLFGFSMAMHHQLQPVKKKMLLVGAPRARALPKQGDIETAGGLYNCDTNSPSTACQRVDFDNEVDSNSESKDNQWMGVTVQSQGPGGKVLTCAHRYQRRRFVTTPLEIRDITGRCYMLSQDLSMNDEDQGDGGNWKFCEGRNSGHEQFGTCQQGLSATFTKDYHYLVFGAPGAYNWKGIVRMEQKNLSLLELGIYDDGPFEVGDEHRKDPDLVPVPASSYLGFSLDSGKSLTKKGQLIIVAGAPRAEHSGEVVLLKKESDTSSALVKEHILKGYGLASSFGYDVTVVDLNGDGWEDIVVGAPQYFEKDGDIGGAVYAYINKAGVWDKITPTRITGSQDSMFGLAVENIGDLNLDSRQDIAVGAPYDDDGAGKVYIYHGSADGIKTSPSQVLLGKPQKAHLFGYSLAGNMDLDGNVYPDVAVGSLSDSAFVYRTKPVININKMVKMTPKELDLTKKNCGDNICLEVKVCFSYTANPASYNPRLVMTYSIEVESVRREVGLPPRVLFRNKAPGDGEYESRGDVVLEAQGKETCITKVLQLQEGIKDKLRSIPIVVNADVKPPSRKRRQGSLPTLLPVLDPNQPKQPPTEVNFLKEGCGSDHVCQSNLQLRYRYCTREPNDNFIPLQHKGGVAQISLSDQKDIALEVTVTNKNGDDAYEATLIGSFPNSLSYSASRTATANTQVICLANKNGSEAKCEFGNPFKRDAEVTFYIILGTGGISLNTTEIEVDLLLHTTSEQKGLATVKAKANVVVELQLSVTGVARPSQINFAGEVKGESAMEKESDIGSQIDYDFRVTNLGKSLSSFGTASLIIHWPRANSQGKWLLYLMKISTKGLSTLGCSQPDKINPLKIKEEPPQRSKRAVSEGGASDAGTISLLTDRKNKALVCGEGADCMEIVCPLQGMDSNAVVMLKARLWNSTFLEDYSSQNYVDIIASASLRLDSTSKNIQLKSQNALVRVTVFPERKAAQYSGMPWWIILVAILLGLLLLGLLVFLLWKCGFFSKNDKHHPEKERLTNA